MDKPIREVMTDVCDPEESRVAFVRDLFGRLGDKWSVRTLNQLADGPLRFTAVMNAMPGISHRILTVTLRTLESDGMVSRTAYAETPPRVEYALTPLGESFLCRSLSLVAWAQDHQQEIEANRAARR
ncbi:helix-turn-helix domain-containing protein [Planotetraspora phitsanulokensis]|uniref:HxlR family transcriptional regulator n=1 Tax=Planotetraspora phitsanulokensis TaxID=575192 RepID=A0A8J3U9P4_9ACTN|nr:helix-turn-helix domain-containing protein [Planotetraspora phitsanulokensis]GII41323.1 HxlR family transcriptional regulator [Planotetraspora phitsanulokensis]